MPLPEPRLGNLRELLKECTALIVPEGGGHGTGFFIDERLLLTCQHVVKGLKGAKVQVQPYNREERSGTVLEAIEGNANDLALVEVDAVDGEDPQPVVVLDRAMGDAIAYYAVGYPEERIAGEVGLEEIVFRGHRRLRDGTAVILLVLDSGKGTVGRGLSGGPVMNAETGAVVAFVQYSNGPSTDAGGGAIPVTRAEKAFPQVKRLLDEPPIATRRWRDGLGQEWWEGLGKSWERRRSIEVVVDGSACAWRVRIDPDDSAPVEVTAGNLPDEVSEALFRWSQRSRVRNPDEVKLLGRLLAGAVFPFDVQRRILENQLADELLIRLRVDGKSDLFNVPWEFVTIQANGDQKYLAASDGFGFVRIAPHPNDVKVSTQPSSSEATVVGIVVEPRAWQKLMPKLDSSGAPTPWPRPGQIAQELSRDVGNSGAFDFLPITDPKPFSVQEELGRKREGAPVEVVHYAGFGRFENGKAQIAFADEYGDVAWRDAGVVFGWVAQSEARLLVVEFLLPRYDVETEPVLPKAFLEALSNRVNAVVFTRFPVHPYQCHTFNVALYRELGQGRTVEAAVQRARSEVAGNEFLGDAAAFGSFTLVTGPKSEMRLVQARVPDSLTVGTKQEPAVVESQPQAAQEPSDVSYTPQ
jgi:Trypsin-like peptidase domain